MLSDTVKQWADELEKVIEENKVKPQDWSKWASYKSSKDRWIEEQHEV